ncbi:ribonuclease BN (tRNA processing enzyme) [Kribbella orskensis]|uniref:Ribonuclease BN (tRNA processing enzyme) n=1 Tax=Kribbella orskensis TaxID=2512216 RepID=A0ABY2BU16_9ACTN|nr:MULTISPECIES: MBL fold metallo-hydrolase [Kribbella]TCN44551.1 ribonuclease BN (tRNA processing enzyme) [Kribbella sp. VKM Ac-2500]TCO31671.1 ribonuclease BN (tRNA processing enzyme) [Kribbella orskensis]
MKLTVLGCSGSVPGPDSPASSYLVTADGFNLVLDLGSGALGALQRYLAVSEIGAIGLSHLHPDHCMDLCGLYVAAKYSPTSPLPRIPVYGPPGTAGRMALAYDLPEDPGMQEELEFHTWQAIQRIGPFTVRTTAMVHPVPAFAIRVEHGNKALVYTGDTGPNDGLVELARGADLLLCEAALRDGDPNNPHDLHMTPADAGEHAKRAEVKRLVITHVPPWFNRDTQAEGARRTFPGDVQVATPGKLFEI